LKTVAAIHTATPMVAPTKQLFAEYLPDVRLLHIADDSLIQDVIRNNCVTPQTARCLTDYFWAAVDAGADLIFNTCSSVGETADLAATLVPVPVIKIDSAMATAAVQRADRIGVLATLPTTLGPTLRLLERKADKAGKTLHLTEGLAAGAFAAVMAGDGEGHDDLILKTARQVAEQVDLLVLAQGSMARMERRLQDETGKPVLSSPKLGVLAVQQALARLPRAGDSGSLREL
jgi:Asp/Glu/hydantoin racemase